VAKKPAPGKKTTTTKSVAKKATVAVADKVAPAAQTRLSPGTAWPFPTGTKP
jgi:hypothetical protein